MRQTGSGVVYKRPKIRYDIRDSKRIGFRFCGSERGLAYVVHFTGFFVGGGRDPVSGH